MSPLDAASVAGLEQAQATIRSWQNNRMSALPAAQFCARSAELGGPYGSTSAAMGSAFHAHAVSPGSPDARRKLAMLTDADEAEVLKWKRPEPITLPDGQVLHYETADKELEVGLTETLEYCPFTDPRAVTRGHLDFAWVVTIGGQRVAYVGDIKRSEWTVLDGPESLQVHAYGMAYASKVGAEAYVPLIWSATEGTYWFGELTEVGAFPSERAEKVGGLILHAARNVPGPDNQYVTGAHCTGCYGRMRCPAYLLPPEYVNSTIGPMTKPDGQLTPEQALNLVILIKRAEETAAAAKEYVQEHVKRGLRVFDPQSGMLYGKVDCRGRERFDEAAAAKDGVNVDKYKSRGPGYSQFRWVKP